MALNRNAESPFATLPMNSDQLRRSKFNRPYSHKTTWNEGELVPIMLDEVLPGDTYSIDMASVMRMATPLFPIMDNLYADFYFFFVPNRIVWEHWKDFMGENTASAWETQIEYSVPQVEAPSNGWAAGTLADHYGLPTLTEDISVSDLPFRGYAMIWNEWFRDQNLKDPANVPLDETTITGSNGTNYVTDLVKGGMPAKAAKMHDYFTSALPEPQKGDPVEIPIEGFPGGTFGVQGNGKSIGFTQGTTNLGVFQQSGQGNGFLEVTTNAYNKSVGTTVQADSGSYNFKALGITRSGESGMEVQIPAAGGAAFNINELRQAFAVQRMLEKDARGGTRYREILHSHFGVISPDASQQIPEYIGGTRVPINIDQVIQTAVDGDIGTAQTPVGSTRAYSLTNSTGHMVTKSFTEHGFIHCLMCVRHTPTYQQGIERMWSRTSRYHYYWPSLANLGEQAILNKEIYAQGDSVVDDDGEIIDEQAFGYQEAWAEYRYKPDQVTGAFRSNTTGGSLDAWHLADDYSTQPFLSSGWIDDDKAPLTRTLAVQSQPQFFGDFYFSMTVTREMPLNSIPGLIDHY